MKNKLDMKQLETLIRAMFELEREIREVQTLSDVECIGIANAAAARNVDPSDAKSLLLETARYCLHFHLVDDFNPKIWSIKDQTAVGRRYYEALEQVCQENEAKGAK